MKNDQFNYQKSIEFLMRKDSVEERKNRDLFQQATKDFNAIVEMIKGYDPKAIYQWGSLLNPDSFDINSDIDIAVGGIKSTEIFFELYGKAMSMTDFPLDLVEIEKVDPIHRESIKTKGKVVYRKR